VNNPLKLSSQEVDNMVEEMAVLAVELSESVGGDRQSSRFYAVQMKFDKAMGLRMARSNEENIE